MGRTSGSYEIHTAFWSENLKKRDHLEELDLDDRVILKRILRK
jgi:hypothetical protein